MANDTTDPTELYLSWLPENAKPEERLLWYTMVATGEVEEYVDLVKTARMKYRVPDDYMHNRGFAYLTYVVIWDNAYTHFFQSVRFNDD